MVSKATLDGEVKFTWIPSSQGLQGNGIADTKRRCVEHARGCRVSGERIGSRTAILARASKVAEGPKDHWGRQNDVDEV